MFQTFKKSLNIIARASAKRIIPLLILLPTEYFQGFLFELIMKKVGRLTPQEAVALLFSIENNLYPLETQAAIAYDSGVHPKHRLTNYHVFFSSRISGDDRVLDVGCRTGDVAFDIARRTSAEVVGIDIDRQSIADGNARHQLPNLKLIVGDAYALELTQQFDVVILSNVLEHLTDRPRLLKQLVSTTKARRFLIRVPHFERDWRVGMKRELGVDWRLDNTHFIEFTLKRFIEETRTAGLSLDDLEIRWGELWASLSV